MDEILYCLCLHCVGIIDGWRPFPATAIAESLGISVHKVRYHLRKLKAKVLLIAYTKAVLQSTEKFFATGDGR